MKTANGINLENFKSDRDQGNKGKSLKNRESELTQTQIENLKTKGTKERQELILKNSKWNKNRRRKRMKQARSFRKRRGKKKTQGQ